MKKFKRIMSTILCLALMLSALPMGASAISFSDVSPTSWYAKDVYALAEKGILNGTGGGKFSPERGLTRAEFAAMLTKTALTSGEINAYKGWTSFKDVPKNEWFAPYINWAYEASIIKGYSDGTFKPNKQVTRQELAHMIVNFSKAMGYKIPQIYATIDFKDNGSILNFAKDSVRICQRGGIINGMPDGNFRPSWGAKRSDTAVMFNRFLTNSQKDPSYSIIRKRISGFPVRAVELDMNQLKGSVLLGNDRVNSAESMGSMIDRTGAKIAVNAAFFDMSTYTPYSTIIKEDKLLVTDMGDTKTKPSFVIDSLGNPSIQRVTLNANMTICKDDVTSYSINKVIANRKIDSSYDTSRVMYTREWGDYVYGVMADHIIVDAEGCVIQVSNTANSEAIYIPKGGYVLCRKAKNPNQPDQDAFFNNAAIGDFVNLKLTHSNTDLSTEYEHVYVDGIYTAISVGPRVVKDGMAYGNKNTYNEEGFYAYDITTSSAKRVAIGVKGNKVVILTANCTLQQLSGLLVSMGCTDAINLDGGGSTGIYVDGVWLSSPNRKLSNMIYFK